MDLRGHHPHQPRRARMDIHAARAHGAQVQITARHQRARKGQRGVIFGYVVGVELRDRHLGQPCVVQRGQITFAQHLALAQAAMGQGHGMGQHRAKGLRHRNRPEAHSRPPQTGGDLRQRGQRDFRRRLGPDIQPDRGMNAL